MIRVPDDATRDLLHVCRRLYERGLVAGTDGNVSIRLSPDRVLATPTGACKGFLTERDLVVCDLAGNQLQGQRRLTTEIKIHLAAYEVRDDVCAIVHAHPPYSTAFAVAGLTPSETLMPEAYIAVGKVALAPYGTPSTDELADSLRPCLGDHDAVLLANHGAMALGRDVIAACNRMEALEQLCRISSITRLLGEARSLGSEEMAKLDAIRGVYGSAASEGPCYACGRPLEHAAHHTTSSKPAGSHPAAERAAQLRASGWIQPSVHWPGNPPVWDRPTSAGTLEEAQVRDLARRTLRELRHE
jgi:L-fuculose-phosphate aldolase